MNDILDFNSLINSDNDDDFDNNNICLISGNLLERNNITLSCGHKFNYLPLYKELYNQKVKKILDNCSLKINEIKCPYCRIKTENILPPFNKYYDVNNVKGVTFPLNYCMDVSQCQYINKKTKQQCNMPGCLTKYGIFCNKHIAYTKNEEDILSNMDNEFYNKYKKRSLKELREELKKNKLKLSGNKNDLINRLFINNYELDQAALEIQETAVLYLQAKLIKDI